MIEMLQHASATDPHESVGFLLGNGKYKPCNNVSADPCNQFEIDANDWLMDEEVTTIIHSHPNGNSELSTQDRIMQIETGLDWWVITDNKKIYKYRNCPALLGREYENVKSDCYTLLRDAYMLSGLDLPIFKYEQDWYEDSNLYLDNMARHGFEQVTDVQLGDIILMCVGTKIPNHAGIYIGDDRFIHHSINKLSNRENYSGYWHKATHSIWRYKECGKLNFTGILNDMAIASI